MTIIATLSNKTLSPSKCRAGIRETIANGRCSPTTRTKSVESTPKNSINSRHLTTKLCKINRSKQIVNWGWILTLSKRTFLARHKINNVACRISRQTWIVNRYKSNYNYKISHNCMELSWIETRIDSKKVVSDDRVKSMHRGLAALSLIIDQNNTFSQKLRLLKSYWH